MRDPRHDILFEPVTIGPKVLRNRFYAVPHSAGMGTGKPESQAAFRGMKAEGGWAAVCTEWSPVSPDSDPSPSTGTRMWEPYDMDALTQVTSAVHAHGALCGIELAHGGGDASRSESRWPAIAPTQFPGSFDTLSVSKEMDAADIRRVQADWVRAAERARDAGFDIVYMYGGAELPAQFLSPVHNRRTDAYGGSFENRARFWIETLEGIAAAVGDTCAVAVRLSVGALTSGGVTRDEGERLVEMLDPMVDLWDVNIETLEEIHAETGASRGFKSGWQFAQTAWVRDVTDKPIVGVGRLTDPDQMADLVRRGVVDLIGGARPSIADPFLPSKIESGRYADIRECIGCNVCVLKAEIGSHLGCTQNATAGEEYRRGWHPEAIPLLARDDRTILVVGGGPAGMETAIVLGKAGALVHLVEESEHLGGHMRWVPRLPGLAEWGRVVEWRESQLRSLPTVQTITGRRLSAADVLDYGADTVIVATGAAWTADGVTGFRRLPLDGVDEQAHRILTPEQIMLENLRPDGRRVIVYDTEGYVTGVGVAELLADEGFEVRIVTPAPAVAPHLDSTGEGIIARQRLRDKGVVADRGTVLTVIGAETVTGLDEFGAGVSFTTDALVMVTRRASNDALYRELIATPDLQASGIEHVYRVGDCVAPRMTADAIFDAHRLAREIESADPSVPRPYLLNTARV